MSNSPLFQIPPGMLALAGQAPGEAPQPKETSPRSRSVKRVSTRANFANDPINRDNLPAGMAALPAAQAKLPPGDRRPRASRRRHDRPLTRHDRPPGAAPPPWQAIGAPGIRPHGRSPAAPPGSGLI